MALAAGRLDRRVALQTHALTRDAMNQPTDSWTTVATVWASWRRASANERLVSGQVGAQVTDIFEIRWSTTAAALNPKGRLIYAGRTYDIIEVTEIGRREGILVRAAARVDQ